MTRTELLAVVGVYFNNNTGNEVARSVASYLMAVSNAKADDPEADVVPGLTEPHPGVFNKGHGIQIKHVQQYFAGEMDAETTLAFMDRMVDFAQSCLLYEIVEANKLDMANVDEFYHDLEILMTPQRRSIAKMLAEGPNLTEVSDISNMLKSVIGKIVGHLETDSNSEAPADGEVRKAEFANFVPGNSTRQ